MGRDLSRRRLLGHLYRFSGACLHVLDAHRRQAKRGFATFETWLVLESPARAARGVLASSILDAGASALRMLHRLYESRGGRPLAHFYQARVHFDFGARRPGNRRCGKKPWRCESMAAVERSPLPLAQRFVYACGMVPLCRRSFLAAAIVALPAIARAQDQSFAAWLQGLRQDALAQGISRGTLDRAFTGIAPIPHVIELDRRQPETTLTFDEYIARVVTPQRRATGRERLAENRPLLEEIGRHYGVQPRFIVALWGIETDFGRLTGTYPVIAALSTLAYDGRRSAFFRRELLNALVIVDRDHIDPDEMLGSWAGAMGQSQFMPSSFLRFAVSYGDKGAPDIWHRPADVFASIANYLSQSGWHGDQTWGRPVLLPAGFDLSRAGLGTRQSLDQWSALGIRRVDGGMLPRSAAPDASLVLPDGGPSPALLAYGNFRTLLRWNNSNFFATAVGYLADSLEGQ